MTTEPEKLMWWGLEVIYDETVPVGEVWFRRNHGADEWQSPPGPVYALLTPDTDVSVLAAFYRTRWPPIVYAGQTVHEEIPKPKPPATPTPPEEEWFTALQVIADGEAANGQKYAAETLRKYPHPATPEWVALPGLRFDPEEEDIYGIRIPDIPRLDAVKYLGSLLFQAFGDFEILWPTEQVLAETVVEALWAKRGSPRPDSYLGAVVNSASGTITEAGLRATNPGP